MLNPEFIKMLDGLGPDYARLSAELDKGVPEVSVRLNQRKPGATPCGLTGPFDRVPWCYGGLYLPERPVFTLDPELHQGRYYVQDASSMCMWLVVNELNEKLGGGELRLLDACAAPGGKTLCAADALDYGSLVVANEYDFRRAEVLRENVIKWGASPMSMVTRGDTARFSRVGELFDIVLVDAPCSGEGMMRKDTVAREQWTPSLVRECVERQREILLNVWSALRPGGYLIYSTCTFNMLENERNVEWFIGETGAESVPSVVAGMPGVLPSLLSGVEAARFVPGHVRGEGLFVSVLHKPGDSAGKPLKIKMTKKGAGRRAQRIASAVTPAQLKEVTSWLNTHDVVIETVTNNKGETSIVALPAGHAPFIASQRDNLDIILQGTPLAEVKGKNLIPSHPLAMSGLLTADAFPAAEVDCETALHYLRGESVTLAETTARGFVLLTYCGQPLGFVKNLGNRANNLYPSSWRILRQL